MNHPLRGWDLGPFYAKPSYGVKTLSSLDMIASVKNSDFLYSAISFANYLALKRIADFPEGPNGP